MKAQIILLLLFIILIQLIKKMFIYLNLLKILKYDQLRF